MGLMGKKRFRKSAAADKPSLPINPMIQIIPITPKPQLNLVFAPMPLEFINNSE